MLAMVALPDWMRRWNFIERARLERQLWDAFERGDDIEALVAECRSAVESGEGQLNFQLDVWQNTLVRIRRIERLMADQTPSGPSP